MSFDVSSGFINTLRGKSPTLIREFYIGTSDYTAYVDRWPKLKRSWNEIRPQNITINLSNEEQTFNFIKNDPTLLNTECSIKMGVQFAASSSETIDVFKGNIGKMSYRDSAASISIIDKFKNFSERLIGDREEPVDLTSGNYLPSDIAWIAITCYGGLSSIESTSNPDIDYETFNEWAYVFSLDTVYVHGHFTGQKITEILKTIGRSTSSSIFEENGKINFARYSISSVEPFSLDTVYSVQLDIDDSKVVNKQVVSAAYDVDSEIFDITVSDTKTASVNSFGLHEQLEESKRFWYVNSSSALNFSQRMTSIYGEPYERYRVRAPMQPLGQSIGDTLNFNYNLYSTGGNAYRIMGYEIDIEKAEFRLDVDATQLTSQFILDDSVDGLLDQAYNPLG